MLCIGVPLNLLRGPILRNTDKYFTQKQLGPEYIKSNETEIDSLSKVLETY